MLLIDACHSAYFHPRAPTRPSTPQSVASQTTCPNSFFVHCFHFRFTFESVKKLGSVYLNLSEKNSFWDKFKKFKYVLLVGWSTYPQLVGDRGKEDLKHNDVECVTQEVEWFKTIAFIRQK